MSDTSAMHAAFPPILWAQRPTKVLVTIPLQDAHNVKIELQEDGRVLCFACDTADKTHYACTLALYDAVSPEESSHVTRPRQIELKLTKRSATARQGAKDDELDRDVDEEWPRLTKEKTRNAQIQVDWNKWQDADAEAEGGDDGLGDFGLGGAGFDANDEAQQQMLNELMRNEGKKDAVARGGAALAGDTLPDFGSAKGQQPVAANPEDDDDADDMPPLEEDEAE